MARRGACFPAVADASRPLLAWRARRARAPRIPTAVGVNGRARRAAQPGAGAARGHLGMSRDTSPGNIQARPRPTCRFLHGLTDRFAVAEPRPFGSKHS
jgi:hypothetical protein